VAAGLARDDYEAAGKPQICWASAEERAALIAELFSDAELVIAACGGLDDADLGSAAGLLATVAGQDIERDEHGAPRIRQGVAPDRIVSTVDPDARHGHRSRRTATTATSCTCWSTPTPICSRRVRRPGPARTTGTCCLDSSMTIPCRSPR
jgi:hypothetical protein